MRIPGLHQLILLLSRSPETEYERAMLLHRLRSRRTRITIGAAILLAGMGAAGINQLKINRELECLALTTYFEARGEPREGQLAVAHVVMNRVADERFPDNVCDVVRDGGEDREDCQFSWWCDHRSNHPTHKADWEAAQDVAGIVYWGGGKDPTGGALWYHATSVRAYWRGQFKKGPTIGNHVFYHDKKAAAGS